jgi:predicted PurR-regulated permease PerM
MVCVLLALTQSWTTTVLTLIAIIIIEVLEGDVLFPRIMGKSVGLHPITSLVAMIAFSELFGLAGALFAPPAAGVIQALLVAFWMSWRDSHPAQFETESLFEKGSKIFAIWQGDGLHRPPDAAPGSPLHFKQNRSNM